MANIDPTVDAATDVAELGSIQVDEPIKLLV